MELNQLRIFLSVVEEGGFTRAATALHLTQPAVSQQIRSLEREFGVELLERRNRLVRPTPAGEVFLEYARGAVSLAERGVSALSAFQSRRRGRLVIGAGNTTITFRLPRLLSVYRQREPQIEIIIKAGHSRELLLMLDKGDVDLALVTSLSGETNHREIKPLFQDEIILILTRDNPLTEKKLLQPEDLQDMPSILFAGASGFRVFLNESFARAGYQPQVVMELDSIEGIKGLVQIGLGLSFLPRIAVEQELNQGELRTVPVAGLTPTTRTTYAVHRREKYPPAPLCSFLNLL